jgi:hypothetical protein
MDVQVSEQVILLKDESVMDRYMAAAHQVATVERVDDAGIHLQVSSNCNWKPQATLVISPEELANPQRFMRVREQVIDGLTFSPEVPTETGHYWFFGKTGRHGKPDLHTVRVFNSGGGASIQYWYGGDMQFSGEFTMIGLWAPQWRPTMPGIND